MKMFFQHPDLHVCRAHRREFIWIIIILTGRAAEIMTDRAAEIITDRVAEIMADQKDQDPDPAQEDQDQDPDPGSLR